MWSQGSKRQAQTKGWRKSRRLVSRCFQLASSVQAGCCLATAGGPAAAAGARTGAPRSVRNMRAVLRRSLNDAQQLALVSRNVAALVRAPKAPRGKMTVDGDEQMRQLLEVARDSRLEALFVLVVITGMREGELLGLRWRSVNLDSKYVQVQSALKLTHSQGPILQDLKTSPSRRKIALTTTAVEALRRPHRESNPDTRFRRPIRPIRALSTGVADTGISALIVHVLPLAVTLCRGCWCIGWCMTTRRITPLPFVASPTCVPTMGAESLPTHHLTMRTVGSGAASSALAHAAMLPCCHAAVVG
jgi:integrase